MARELVDAALLAVDDADRVGYTQSGVAERLDRLDRGPARGDDVLDQADALALLVHALEPVAPCRTPSRPCGRSGTAGPTRATPPPRARPRRAPAPRGGQRPARARARPRRAPRRAAPAGRGASRSGTCRGSSASGGRSGARSRLRGTRRRAAPARGHPRSSARASSSCAIGSRRSASAVPSPNECHRAVVGVEVDALALPCGAAAQEHRAGERAGGEQDAGHDLTRWHRSAFVLRGRAAPPSGFSLRRLVDRAQARLEVVEDEADGRLGRGRRRDQARAVAHDEDAADERRSLELREPAAAARPPRPPRAGASRRRRSARPPARRRASSRPALPSASITTTSRTCGEISVRSAIAWAASIAPSILPR